MFNPIPVDWMSSPDRFPVVGIRAHQLLKMIFRLMICCNFTNSLSHLIIFDMKLVFSLDSFFISLTVTTSCFVIMEIIEV